jgi:hypothetical protein
MSAVDGVARLARRFGNQRIVAGMAAAALLLCAILPGGLPLWRLFRPAHYTLTASDLQGYALLQQVPGGASVIAQAAIVPHLSRRKDIYVLGRDNVEGEYVLAARALSPWPAASFDELEQQLRAFRTRGYVVLHEDNDWTLLRRGGP